MVAEQPYIYPKSIPYSAFDPKAVTRASWAPRPQYSPDANGPLLDFNRHPDSWLIGRSPRDEVKLLSNASKKSIIGLRWVQLVLRALQELAAIGLLVCVVTFKNLQSNDEYIVRVPVRLAVFSPAGIYTSANKSEQPAADILISCYGVYHLSRKATGRTAGSSASYHLFASVLDFGFVPFYVYIFLKARSVETLPLKSEFRWTTLFKEPAAMDKMLFITWVISIATTGLHTASFFISVYLCYMFRKIDNMPPDMNPLEDNLTSKRRTKHKYKSSEIVVTNEKKHDSALSLVSSDRTLTEHDRPVSFFHTRNQSSTSFSPHNPRTAQASRDSMAIPDPSAYFHMRSQRSSQATLRPGSQMFSGEDEAHLKSMMSGSSHYSSESDPRKDNGPRIPRKSSKRVASSDGNWMVLEGDEYNYSDDEKNPGVSVVDEEDEEDSFTRGDDFDQKGHRLQFMNRQQQYAPVAGGSLDALDRQLDPIDGDLGSPRFRDSAANTDTSSGGRVHKRTPSFLDPDFKLQPLGMNPPSPQRSSFYSYRDSNSTLPSAPPTSQSPRSPVNVGRVRNENVKPASVMGAYTTNEFPPESPNSDSRSSSPKGKYYGDLRSAMQGIRSDASSPTRGSPKGSPTLKTGQWMANIPNSSKGALNNVIGSQWPLRNSTESFSHTSHARTANHEKSRDGGERGRVVSRSGVDMEHDGDSSNMAQGGYGGNGRRLVSGKMAEEGMAGGASSWWSGARRRVSGRGQQ